MTDHLLLSETRPSIYSSDSEAASSSDDEQSAKRLLRAKKLDSDEVRARHRSKHTR